MVRPFGGNRLWLHRGPAAARCLYSPSFLSPEYLLQQLKVASFLGVIATGMMLVILLGQIDLSVPWVVALGGMMSSAIAAWGPVGEALAIPFESAAASASGSSTESASPISVFPR